MTGVLKGLLVLLEERLVEHDENRKEVQNKLKEACSSITKDADSLEERISGKISEDFNAKEEEILGLIEKLNKGEGGDMDALVKKAKKELSREWKYEIQHSDSGVSFVDSYKLEVSSVKVEKELIFDSIESIISKLQEHLEKIQRSKDAAQEKLGEICNGRRKEAEELEGRVNEKLEEVFNAEDARIQEVVKMVKERIDSEYPDVVEELTKKAKLTLLKNQKYSLLERGDSIYSFDLKVEKEAAMKFADFEEKKPTKLVPSFTEKGEFTLSFTFLNEDEVDVLKGVELPFGVEVKVWEKGHEEEDTLKTLIKKFSLERDEHICFRSTFTASTTYYLRMRITSQGMSTQWGDEAEFITPEFKDFCIWKECPDNVDGNRKYSVDVKNPRIATFIGNNYCTIIGNTSLPRDRVTSWNIKILKSRWNNGSNMYIGVAPSDINQDERCNIDKCGWYFYFYESKLSSGPPHSYEWKEYGPRKGDGDYVRTGDSVGVVMDTAKGDLSFAVNGVNYGVAYEGIPLDKPLVPCALLWSKGDSVELDTNEVEETVNTSVPAPPNIVAKNTTWGSITLTWDAVEGASFYQIEVDESKFWGASTTNRFIKRGLLPRAAYSFRVRAVRGNSASEWSDVVYGKTVETSFEASGWKECPEKVDREKKYSVDEESLRIATKTDGYGMCTIIGNTPLPPNQVTSWRIKVLESRNNDGSDIYIGVAPSDIDQNEKGNEKRCGWYFSCYSSKVCSGPPHKCEGKEYGPRKDWGEYVHNGDSVGVVMDTTKGELSFKLSSFFGKRNRGAAFEGIPLDKPLVPCVLLSNLGDSVELDTSDVKENDSSCIIS